MPIMGILQDSYALGVYYNVVENKRDKRDKRGYDVRWQN